MTDTDIKDNNTELNKKLTDKDTSFLSYTYEKQSPTKLSLSDLFVDHSINNKDLNTKIKMEKQRMANDTYTKTEIDLKLDKINSDVKHGFEKVDLKFDQVSTEIRGGFENMGLRMEKMFSDFKLEQQKEKEENKKWLIGLAIGSFLSIIGIVVSIIAILAQK